MAITFHSIPTDYSPSDNPLTYVWSSDQTGQQNFYYKVETILGVATVSEDIVYLEVSDRSHIDVSPIISKLLNLPRITSDLSTSLDIIDSVSIKVTEVYGDPPTDQATLTSSTSNVFKASLGAEQWEDTNFLTTYVDTKWLTDTPTNTFRVIRGQDAISAILTTFPQAIEILFYDSAGVLLDTYNGLNEFNAYWQINVSSDNMDFIYTGLDYDDVASFTVQVGSSELLTFIYVDDYCFGIHELVWLNKYGTFDQYPIEHNVTSNTDIESRSYRKKYGSWIDLRYSYDHNSSGNIDFEKRMTDKGSLVTNYMTDTIQNWFVTAYESPQCYLYDPTGLLFRTTLTDTNYRKKQGRFDELIMEEMKYEKTMTRKSVGL